jgi:hypothetical protein
MKVVKVEIKLDVEDIGDKQRAARHSPCGADERRVGPDLGEPGAFGSAQMSRIWPPDPDFGLHDRGALVPHGDGHKPRPWHG